MKLWNGLYICLGKRANDVYSCKTHFYAIKVEYSRAKNGPPCEKTGILHMRKQRSRSASRSPKWNLLCLYSSVCVGPGRKPRRLVFSQRGSYKSGIQWGKISVVSLITVGYHRITLDTACGCTAGFVLDLVGNPEDRFSHNEALMSKIHSTLS